MDILGIQFPELILIMVVATIIFGPDKLPEMMRTVGRWVNKFRQMSEEVRAEVSKEINLSEMQELRKELTGTVAETRNELAAMTSSLQSEVREAKEQYFTQILPDANTDKTIINSSEEKLLTEPNYTSGASLIEAAVEESHSTLSQAEVANATTFSWVDSLMNTKPANPIWRGPTDPVIVSKHDIIQTTEVLPIIANTEGAADGGEPPVNPTLDTNYKRTPRIAKNKPRSKNDNV